MQGDKNKPTDGEMNQLLHSIVQSPKMKMEDLNAAKLDASMVLVNLHSQSVLTQSVVQAQRTTEAKETISTLRLMETRGLIGALNNVSGYSNGVVDQEPLVKIVLPPGTPVANLVDCGLELRERIVLWNPATK